MLSSISSTILATTVFLFLFLPGFVFLRRFWNSTKGDLQDNGTFIYLIWGTPVAILIYSVLYWLYFAIYELTTWEFFNVNLDAIYKSATVNSALKNQQAYNLLHFSIAATISAGFIGQYLHVQLLKRQLDMRYKVLKFSNDWLYLLTGRDYAFENKLKGVTTNADILCVIDHSVVVYSGTVLNYNLNKDGTLDYILLQRASRAPAEKLTTPVPLTQGDHFEVPGHILIIRGADIKNVSCHYKPYSDLDMYLVENPNT